ncbi:hypothetical protein IE81DRAFT_332102 [Ceraceosorus guamensis]|uniref:CCHC-type domain-containing protein n=1 Tax=Ceraceosorus guamensis TaxID=1522189 RepID=A0A316VRA8_9BASI|nr:hypothetical protein IE81DRAFT_332102 [Ceraceosorus guamensis]PWN39754.1 hypothetical protein IE81DRAFT_332102 [Ceraceosorus guamensis]
MDDSREEGGGNTPGKSTDRPGEPRAHTPGFTQGEDVGKIVEAGTEKRPAVSQDGPDMGATNQGVKDTAGTPKGAAGKGVRSSSLVTRTGGGLGASPLDGLTGREAANPYPRRLTKGRETIAQDRRQPRTAMDLLGEMGRERARETKQVSTAKATAGLGAQGQMTTDSGDEMEEGQISEDGAAAARAAPATRLPRGREAGSVASSSPPPDVLGIMRGILAPEEIRRALAEARAGRKGAEDQAAAGQTPQGEGGSAQTGERAEKRDHTAATAANTQCGAAASRSFATVASVGTRQSLHHVEGTTATSCGASRKGYQHLDQTTYLRLIEAGGAPGNQGGATTAFADLLAARSSQKVSHSSLPMDTVRVTVPFVTPQEKGRLLEAIDRAFACEVNGHPAEVRGVAEVSRREARQGRSAFEVVMQDPDHLRAVRTVRLDWNGQMAELQWPSLVDEDRVVATIDFYAGRAGGAGMSAEKVIENLPQSAPGLKVIHAWEVMWNTGKSKFQVMLLLHVPGYGAQRDRRTFLQAQLPANVKIGDSVMDLWHPHTQYCAWHKATGHTIRDCPKLKCDRCGKIGHKAIQCKGERIGGDGGWMPGSAKRGRREDQDPRLGPGAEERTWMIQGAGRRAEIPGAPTEPRAMRGTHPDRETATSAPTRAERTQNRYEMLAEAMDEDEQEQGAESPGETHGHPEKDERRKGETEEKDKGGTGRPQDASLGDWFETPSDAPLPMGEWAKKGGGALSLSQLQQDGVEAVSRQVLGRRQRDQGGSIRPHRGRSREPRETNSPRHSQTSRASTPVTKRSMSTGSSSSSSSGGSTERASSPSPKMRK